MKPARTPDKLPKGGVSPKTARLAIGFEHVDESLADLDRALREAVPT